MRDYKSGLKKSELEHGAYYRGICRNAFEARWNADEQCFYHWRTKFSKTFTEKIKHYEDDNVFDVFTAEAKIEKPYRDIPFGEQVYR